MISKEESLRLKGIAILMMLFLHLFNTPERIALCSPLIYVGGKYPLVHLLTRITALCVPIYIFLSGYGLNYIYERTEGKGMRRFNRLLRLYANYWVVFALFIPLACRVNPTDYPVSLSTFLLNLTGLSYSYNREWWFLMPYMFWVILSPAVIRLVHRQTVRNVIVSSIGILIFFIVMHSLRGTIPDFTGKDFMFGVLLLMFPFYSGIVFAHHRVLGHFRDYTARRWGEHKNLYLWSLLFAFLLLRCILKTGVVNVFYGVLFITLFTATDRSSVINSIFAFFGKHSANMWLSHTFFSWYLFADYFYWFQYPVVIYAALIAVSLGTSYLIRIINTPLQRFISRLPF